MKILIVADPISGLKPHMDSSLGMAREALARGHEVYWANDFDVTLSGKDVWAHSFQILECPQKSLPTKMTPAKATRIGEYHTVWIRKDPPFNESYLTLCWLLSLEEKKGGPLFINRPSQLLKFHEKLLPFFALKEGFLTQEDLIPTVVSAPFLPNDDVLSPIQSHEGEFIYKPWLGHGGLGVEKSSELSQAILKTKTHRALIQPLVSEISTQGDRRAFFLDGKYVGGFVRIPQQGQYISNIAQGGKGEIRALTEREQNLCSKLEQFLQSIEIFVAGVDLLAGRVSEINVTSPTGYLKYIELGGPALIPKYFDLIEAKIKA